MRRVYNFFNVRTGNDRPDQKWSFMGCACVCIAERDRWMHRNIWNRASDCKVKLKWHINMNQIALKANMIGFINEEAYWENSRRLQEAISDLKRQITFMD